eukprot:scaffold2707_cov417-Prasinococcus_capsulatus_cf.AAC.17
MGQLLACACFSRRQVPAFAMFLLWTYVLQPYMSTWGAGGGAADTSGIPENESRADKRKRERAERKQQAKAGKAR